MGVASGCGEQEAGVASGWNLWVWLAGGGYGLGLSTLFFFLPIILFSNSQNDSL